jgi:hypothetical protein
MTTHTATHRDFNGTISGQLREEGSLRVRISAGLSLHRDSDGSWLVYSEYGPTDDDVSASVGITDPAACAAVDALFELIADPVSFEGRTIGEHPQVSMEAAQRDSGRQVA